jgi:hypothetical protein
MRLHGVPNISGHLYGAIYKKKKVSAPNSFAQLNWNLNKKKRKKTRILHLLDGCQFGAVSNGIL